MVHSNEWSDAPLVIGDQAGQGFTNINTTHDDVSDRMQLEHNWAGSGGGDGTTSDGMHKPGFAGVAENQTAEADIAGDHATAINGSFAVTTGTLTPYVKVGAEELANGTWKKVHQDFGAWASVTVGASPTATTAGFVVVTCTVAAVGNDVLATGQTPSGTVRGYARSSWATGSEGERTAHSSFTMPVKNGATYKVIKTVFTGAGDVNAYFIPLV